MESRSSDSRSPRYAPFVRPAVRDRAKLVPEGAADPPADDDYPLIEQFLDELPSIEDYLEDATVQPEIAATRAVVPSEHDDEGWAISAWQSYDWNSLAHLGRPSSDLMLPEETWTGDSVSISAGAGPSADEVAAALDDMAQRIRTGELQIDHLRNSGPEAAMAAVIAAMLRLRG